MGLDTVIIGRDIPVESDKSTLGLEARTETTLSLSKIETVFYTSPKPEICIHLVSLNRHPQLL